MLDRVVLTFPGVAPALAAGRVARVGYLDGSSRRATETLFNAFREGMHMRGWVEGSTLTLLDRWAGGDDDRLPGLVTDLLGQRIDVLVTAGVPPSVAAQRLTTTLPIVLVGVFDPVRLGLVTSLARPGGNVTGMSSMASDTTARQLQLLTEVAPHDRARGGTG